MYDCGSGWFLKIRMPSNSPEVRVLTSVNWNARESCPTPDLSPVVSDGSRIRF